MSLRGDSPINARARVVNDGVNKKQVGFGDVVDRQKWRASGVATGQRLDRTSRHKVVVVEVYVVFIFFVGKSLKSSRSKQRDLVNSGGHGVELIRVNMGVCAPGITAKG